MKTYRVTGTVEIWGKGQLYPDSVGSCDVIVEARNEEEAEKKALEVEYPGEKATFDTEGNYLYINEVPAGTKIVPIKDTLKELHREIYEALDAFESNLNGQSLFYKVAKVAGKLEKFIPNLDGYEMAVVKGGDKHDN